MPDIRCPNCGKINPDFFDACQFCQTPLKPESMLHIGDKPTKKDTGELEPVLPEWLRDVRKQSRDAAEEDTIQAASKSKSQKEDPPDLLAGLAFQSESSDEEEIPDWLASLSGAPQKEKPAPATPAPSENDFFAQFEKSGPVAKPEPAHEEETPSWMDSLRTPSEQASNRDELADWFAQASEEPANQGHLQADAGWSIPPEEPAPAQPAPKDEDLSWLHNLEDESKKTGELPSPKQDGDWFADLGATSDVPASSSGQDDLGWLNNLGGFPAPEQPAQKPSESKEDLGWLKDFGVTSASSGPAQQPVESKDDLSWLNDFGAPSIPAAPAQQPAEPKEDLSWLKDFGAAPASSESVQQPLESKDDLSWLNNFGTTPASEPAQQPSEAKDDLSWLNDFGATPVSNEPAQQPVGSKDDLSWLSDFGTPSTPIEPVQQPAESKDDLSWLNSFGSTPAPAEPAPQTFESKDDLSWLNGLGAAETPASEPASSQPQEDLSWLNALGTPQEAQPTSAPTASDDLGWLGSLPGSSDALPTEPFSDFSFDQDQPVTPADDTDASPYSPRQTARLNPDEEVPVPDWLKSATEAPSMPVNAGDLDQFRGDFNIPSAPEQPFSWKNFASEEKDQEAPPSTPERAFIDSVPFTPGDDSSTLSNKDVDSLFSMDMPDWLSRPAPEETEKPSEDIGIHAEGGEALSPVDLPSWVQAMRPMEAVISDTPAVDDQPTEKEGPLAGFKGVIPAVPIGSSRRPQPIALKLQASDEQQASAAIMEQILVSETSPRALLSVPTLASQRALRQVIAILMFVLLGAVIFMRTQIMQISAALPADVDAASRTLEIVPDGSSVLVVVDYEPALAGEMEATSGPLLNHLVLLRHPRLSFISTSPNGSGLVERLMRVTGINTSTGLAYREGENYFNLGYLPGGESGVLAFVQSPQSASPLADASGFSQYSAVILLTDHADSARSWIEQLQTLKQADPSITNQPLLVVSSAQAGPMLQPYVASRQVNGLVNGLADAARYEHKNNVPPGMGRSYWDAFGLGIILAIALIVLGSLWSLFARFRTSRAAAEEG